MFNIERYIDELDEEYLSNLADTPEKQFLFLILLEQNIEKIRVFNMLLTTSPLAFVLQREKQEKFLEEYKRIVILEKPEFIDIMLFFDDMFKEYFKSTNYIYN